jgi:UDP-N-acetylglucosamine:LPS N-acetylglucosamine transferase
LVISNHYLLTTSFALAKRRLGLQLPVLTFATETHNVSANWADPWADHIIVPNEGVKGDLERMGVPAHKVSVVGYPVQQDFLHAPSKTEARKEIGLEGFTCLVSLGGEGIGGDIERILSPLLVLEAVHHLIVICGRNESLKTSLQHRYATAPKVRIEGFVNNMATHIAASDVVIGKAGPASVYETLAVGRPMLITSYAGLNEKGVLQFVVDKGLGAYLPQPELLKAEVLRYATSQDLLERVAKEASALGLEHQTRALALAVVRYARDHIEGQARAA